VLCDTFFQTPEKLAMVSRELSPTLFKCHAAGKDSIAGREKNRTMLFRKTPEATGKIRQWLA
jgi:hypothetical protein